MKNKNFSDILKDLENDNISELSNNNTPHEFSKAFEKQAVSVCHGKNTENKLIKRRKIPLWAAVLIAILVTALISGCAVAVYHHYFRSVPYLGIVDGNAEAALYSTTDLIEFDGISVETVLYVKNGDKGRLLLWAHFESAESPLNTTVAQIRSGEKTYDVICNSSGNIGTRWDIFAEAVDAELDFDEQISIVCNGTEKPLLLSDITDKGYEVSEWAVVEGITLKILPIYTNNRILLLEAEGLGNAIVTATAVLYDSDGNSVRYGECNLLDDRYCVMTASERLQGEVVKIELTGLRIVQNTEVQAFTVPLTESEELDIPLYKTAMFKDKAVALRFDGTYWYLTTELKSNGNTEFADFSIYYNLENTKMHEWGVQYGDDGTYIYTHKFEMTEETAELRITVSSYSCMMFSGDGPPLAEIDIKKK